jgi:hypothetical protein
MEKKIVIEVIERDGGIVNIYVPSADFKVVILDWSELWDNNASTDAYIALRKKETEGLVKLRFEDY